MDGRTDDRSWPQNKDGLFIGQVTRPIQVIMSERDEKSARNFARLNISGDFRIDGTILVKRVTYQQGVVWSHLDEDRIQ